MNYLSNFYEISMKTTYFMDYNLVVNINITKGIKRLSTSESSKLQTIS